MQLQDIQKLFIDCAIKVDPQGQTEIERELSKRNEYYQSLPDSQKAFFDKESLTNPYYDSKILYGAPETEVKNILVGIDVKAPELLLAKQLIKDGRKIDLVCAHHPAGRALSVFSKVGFVQINILARLGLPVSVAENLITPKINDILNQTHAANCQNPTDAARLLNIPFMCAHTVADNQVSHFLQKNLDDIKPLYLCEIIDFLNSQPEYNYARSIYQEPFILLGTNKSRCGKIFVDMTGGFEGPIEIYKYLAQAGVSTIVAMCLSKEAQEKAQKNGLNVVIAGHISSDNLGVNLMLDELEKKDEFEIIEFSGFKRFKRNYGDTRRHS
ncbi:MAG: NGG1p interacting factor NIF3 [Elusimicrobiota bacterium]|jgi:putative NIF3 family GTP cyclohydrolase 1 type 2|nr:NGG1p interacting factor NIF3 [Elusimicrobiota bacterium]